VRSFAGAWRFVCNNALALTKDRYTRPCDVPAQPLQQSLKDLDQAYINFFKDRANSPVFRKKSRKDSFRIPQGFEVDSANGRVKLPKLGWAGATIPVHDPVTGEIWPASLFVIVLRTSSYTYAEATSPSARFCEPHRFVVE
jgi:transposase